MIRKAFKNEAIEYNNSDSPDSVIDYADLSSFHLWRRRIFEKFGKNDSSQDIDTSDLPDLHPFKTDLPAWRRATLGELVKQEPSEYVDTLSSMIDKSDIQSFFTWRRKVVEKALKIESIDPIDTINFTGEFPDVQSMIMWRGLLSRRICASHKEALDKMTDLHQCYLCLIEKNLQEKRSIPDILNRNNITQNIIDKSKINLNVSFEDMTQSEEVSRFLSHLEETISNAPNYKVINFDYENGKVGGNVLNQITETMAKTPKVRDLSFNFKKAEIKTITFLPQQLRKIKRFKLDLSEAIINPSFLQTFLSNIKLPKLKSLKLCLNGLQGPYTLCELIHSTENLKYLHIQLQKSSGVAQTLKSVLENLTSKGLKGLKLDLSNNQWLKADKLIDKLVTRISNQENLLKVFAINLANTGIDKKEVKILFDRNHKLADIGHLSVNLSGNKSINDKLLRKIAETLESANSLEYFALDLCKTSISNEGVIDFIKGLAGRDILKDLLLDLTNTDVNEKVVEGIYENLPKSINGLWISLKNMKISQDGLNTITNQFFTNNKKLDYFFVTTDQSTDDLKDCLQKRGNLSEDIMFGFCIGKIPFGVEEKIWLNRQEWHEKFAFPENGVDYKDEKLNLNPYVSFSY